MLTFDWIILIIWLLGALKGLQTGAVKQLLSFAAFFVGLIAAKMFYISLGDKLCPMLNEHTSVANFIAFVVIWITVPIALSVVADFCTSILSHIVVVGTLNRLLGAVVSFLKYELILGTIIWFCSYVELISPELMEHSTLCGPLKSVPESIYIALIG